MMVMVQADTSCSHLADYTAFPTSVFEISCEKHYTI